METATSNALDAADVARLEALSAQLRRQAADIAAAEYRWLVALEEFDRDGGYAIEGAKTMTEWLSWACGIGGEAARERVRVARAIRDLPLVSERFAKGELSYSKVRAITRVATPETEEALVTYGCHATASQLEAVVRGFRRIRPQPEPPPDGAEELAHREQRTARWGVDEDGYVRISAKLPADDGMLVVQALQSVADDLAEQPADSAPEHGDRADPALGVGDRPVASKRWQTPEPAEVRMADALRIMAETTLEHGPAERAADERYQVVVVVRHDQRPVGAHPETQDNEPAAPSTSAQWLPPHLAHLAGRADSVLPLSGEPLPAPEPFAYIAGGPALSEATVRRISCDATLVAMVEDALGRPLGVGRQSRVVPRRLRRALARRDRGCRFPGCTTTRHLDAHHVWHWALGGPTELDNLLLVCRFHHTLLHEGNFSIALLAPGRFTFHRPDGTTIEASAPSPGGDPDQMVAENLTAGVAPTALSLVPDWDGTRQDIGAAVEGLAYLDMQGREGDADGDAPDDVSAETSPGGEPQCAGGRRQEGSGVHTLFRTFD